MNSKNIILLARFFSAIFSPFYLQLVGLAILFLFTNLSYYPLLAKLVVMALAYIFTILLPTMLIRTYRNYHGWTPIELGRRERRLVPYAISIVCNFSCIYFMRLLHIPHFMGSILIAALFIQIICALINTRWKISTHSAAIGGVSGSILAFAHVFIFNPSWWLSIVVIIAGIVGTSRMLLRQHSLGEVIGGFLIGALTAFLVILLM